MSFLNTVTNVIPPQGLVGHSDTRRETSGITALQNFQMQTAVGTTDVTWLLVQSAAQSAAAAMGAKRTELRAAVQKAEAAASELADTTSKLKASQEQVEIQR